MNLSNECLHEIFIKNMGIEENSLELRILYPDVKTGTTFYESEVKDYKDGDHKLASTLRKFAIPTMTLCVSHG